LKCDETPQLLARDFEHVFFCQQFFIFSGKAFLLEAFPLRCLLDSRQLFRLNFANRQFLFVFFRGRPDGPMFVNSLMCVDCMELLGALSMQESFLQTILGL